MVLAPECPILQQQCCNFVAIRVKIGDLMRDLSGF